MASESSIVSPSIEELMRSSSYQLFMGLFDEYNASTGDTSFSVCLVFIPGTINTKHYDQCFAYIIWIDRSRTDSLQNTRIVYLGGPYKLQDLEKNSTSEGSQSIHIQLVAKELLVSFEGGSPAECLETIQRSVLGFPTFRESRSNRSTGSLSSLFGRASAQERPYLTPLTARYWIAEWMKWLGEGFESRYPSWHILDMVRGAGVTRDRIVSFLYFNGVMEDRPQNRMFPAAIEQYL